MAKRYSNAAHSKRRKQTSHVLKNTVILLFCAVGIWFGSSLWHAALTLQAAQPAESIAGEEFHPQVGDPPYRVVIDAGLSSQYVSAILMASALSTLGSNSASAPDFEAMAMSS